MTVGTKVNIKYPCPICENGEGRPKYSELSLERHLFNFHRRIDASELTDKWVSDKLKSHFIKERIEEDREIAENMRDYWANLSAGSCDWRG